MSLKLISVGFSQEGWEGGANPVTVTTEDIRISLHHPYRLIPRYCSYPATVYFSYVQVYHHVKSRKFPDEVPVTHENPIAVKSLPGLTLKLRNAIK